MPDPSPEFFALQAAVAGRYSLVSEIGRGGMGIVFAARDVALDRAVAIKVLPPALATSDDARRRFVREARTAASLAHPHIVPIHAVEERGELVYFVMTLVEGESLGQRVRRAGPLPPLEAMRVVQEVAWALAHAHARGVVHRDVKPDNILLERDSGRAMVTDFGIAHAAGRDTPVDGVALGTPAYMSPEQGRGEEPDARSDIYALGITAWMAAAGRLPFPGPDANAYFVQHASVQAPPLAPACANVSPAFARAVDQCLAKSPADRWASAESLAVAMVDERSRLPAVPAPVRAFLREWDRVGAEVATAGTGAGVAAILALAMKVMPNATFTESILATIYLLISALMGSIAAERFGQLGVHARILRRRGFDVRSLASAMQRALPERAEEAKAEQPGDGRAAMVTGLATLGAGAASVWGLMQNTGDATTIMLAATSVVAPTVGVRTLWAHLNRRNPDGLWNRLAGGWLGRALFRVASVGVGSVPLLSADSGEPTVLAIGAQARRAYAALPGAEREQLRDVPTLVEALEQEAMRLRAVEATPATGARLESAMAALELLRLDLLKLGAANAGAGELTAAIERVKDVGYRVDGLVDVNRG